MVEMTRTKALTAPTALFFYAFFLTASCPSSQTGFWGASVMLLFSSALRPKPSLHCSPSAGGLLRERHQIIDGPRCKEGPAFHWCSLRPLQGTTHCVPSTDNQVSQVVGEPEPATPKGRGGCPGLPVLNSPL